MLTDALATRILFEGDRAVGVEVLRGNALEQVRAGREVIVCAGAYQSPQLLMLSGIGPADELAPFGIEQRQDLPGGAQPAGPRRARRSSGSAAARAC